MLDAATSHSGNSDPLPWTDEECLVASYLAPPDYYIELMV